MFFVEGLAQVAICPIPQGARPHPILGKCGIEDDRQALTFGNQAVLQLNSSQARHLHVGDDAR